MLYKWFIIGTAVFEWVIFSAALFVIFALVAVIALKLIDRDKR